MFNFLEKSSVTIDPFIFVFEWLSVLKHAVWNKPAKSKSSDFMGLQF